MNGDGGVVVMLSLGHMVNACCLRLFWRIMTAMENQISLEEPTTTASLYDGGPVASAAASNSTATAEEAKSAKPATRPVKVMSVLSSLPPLLVIAIYLLATTSPFLRGVHFHSLLPPPWEPCHSFRSSKDKRQARSVAVRAYVGDFRQLCLLGLSTAVIQKFNQKKLPATLEEVRAAGLPPKKEALFPE